jgi:hypothetical protein
MLVGVRLGLFRLLVFACSTSLGFCSSLVFVLRSEPYPIRSLACLVSIPYLTKSSPITRYARSDILCRFIYRLLTMLLAWIFVVLSYGFMILVFCCTLRTLPMRMSFVSSSYSLSLYEKFFLPLPCFRTLFLVPARIELSLSSGSSVLSFMIHVLLFRIVCLRFVDTIIAI